MSSTSAAHDPAEDGRPVVLLFKAEQAKGGAADPYAAALERVSLRPCFCDVLDFELCNAEAVREVRAVCASHTSLIRANRGADPRIRVV